MASPRYPVKGRFTLLALVIAAIIAFAQLKGWLPEDVGGINQTSPEQQREAKAGTKPERTVKPGGWEELSGCTLEEDRGNDGDSFVVNHDGTTHTIRLYFVDCPEKYRHQFNGPRIAEQGQYFDGLTEAETVAIGEAARDFSLGILRGQPFTILTRRERVYDSERLYAFVAAGKGDLAEQLVARGLGRIHTKGEQRPGGPAAALEKRRLQDLERKAKAANAGAWAAR